MEPLIKGIDVHKRYVMGKDNYVDALRGASVEVGEGEMVAIMGPSGSGKSTLLHILGCLDSLDSGEVWLDGRRVDTLNGSDLTELRRDEVGFIFQTFNLVPSLTALENVTLAAQYAGKRQAGGPRSRDGGPRRRRPGRPPEAPADRAVRRSAAAGGHRPGAGQRPPGDLRRRAHRQPRLGQLGRGRRA